MHAMLISTVPWKKGPLGSFWLHFGAWQQKPFLRLPNGLHQSKKTVNWFLARQKRHFLSNRFQHKLADYVVNAQNISTHRGFIKFA